MIKQIQSRSEFLTTSRTPSPDRIQTLSTLYPRALALVLFENLDMASSSFGGLDGGGDWPPKHLQVPQRLQVPERSPESASVPDSLY